MESAGIRIERDAFMPRTVGITARGVDRVVADKAEAHCPRLEGLAPWFWGAEIF